MERETRQRFASVIVVAFVTAALAIVKSVIQIAPDGLPAFVNTVTNGHAVAVSFTQPASIAVTPANEGRIVEYVKPEDVVSPKAHWYLFEVVLDRGKWDCAYALGEWDGDRRVGFRWNGGDGNPIGNPQSRGYATWTILDPNLYEAFIETLCPPEKQNLAREFLGISGRA